MKVNMASDRSYKFKDRKVPARLFQTLVENSSDGIHVLDKNGNVVCCSHSFAELLGYTMEEALRLNVRDWDRKFPDEQIVPVIQQLIEQPDLFETKHLKKNGELLDVEINARGVLLDGQYYLYASSRNITLKKELTENLKKANFEIEQFVYAVSHDLKAPLVSIMGYLGRIKKHAQELDEKERGWLERIEANALGMRQLLNDLLEMSKSANLELVISDNDLHKEAKEVLELLSDQVEDSNASIRLDPLPKLKFDSERLRQVLSNLIGNALKYNDKNAPHIHISCIEKQTQFQVSIKDNGPGIPDQYHAKIFDSFERGDSTDNQGTGLGLSICKAIIEKHKGEIWLESSPETGATFHFTLPKAP
ncbi:MAG: hypothetical protein CL675_02955 [Bdellovibrionaceae bacterium]|nr:hypothetical protein [Pseudobdellovibrionaceae bacterium]